MAIPSVGIGETSIVVLALLIVKEVVVHVLQGRRNSENGYMKISDHEERCKLKLKPIHDGISDLKETAKSNRAAIDRNLEKVMEEIKDLPRKMNGGK